MFALVADGKNGLRVVQLISPDTVPEAAGFDPEAESAPHRDLSGGRRGAGGFARA
jgi:hypothetical protein